MQRHLYPAPVVRRAAVDAGRRGPHIDDRVLLLVRSPHRAQGGGGGELLLQSPEPHTLSAVRRLHRAKALLPLFHSWPSAVPRRTAGGVAHRGGARDPAGAARRAGERSARGRRPSPSAGGTGGGVVTHC
eukprot:COSAG03_NODE_1339_length_4295_cov_11.594852_4_plen_130_part_00